MLKRTNLILLFLIIALAFVLRFYKVTEVPPSLNWDEVSIGYNAYSILKTGRDEWGRFLPLHFESYGEYKLPAQIYASIPGIAIFGLNEMGVRITPVIYGTLTVFLLFFLVNSLTSNKWISLLSAFFLAISPWHIQLTRASFESSFSVFWVVMGIWFLVKGFKKPYWWIVSMLPFTVSVYTYNSARVFTPLFLLFIGIVYFKRFWSHRKEAIISVLLFGALLVLLVPFIVSGEAAARYKLVSITNDPGLVPRIEERRNNSKFPPLINRLINNRVTYTSYYFASNYLAHFTPDFLFIHGAGHKQHHVQNVGEMFAVQVPFVLLGVFFLFRKKYKFNWLIVGWILITFIPVSLTNDSIPNALRTLIAAAPYQVLTAIGIYELYLWLNNKSTRGSYLLWVSVGLLLIASFISYLNNLFNIYPRLYSRDWQYGNKEVVSYIKDHYSDYDLVVFTRYYGEPHMFTLFYLNYPPDKYMFNPNLERFKANDWVWVTRFDKFYFPNLSDQDSDYKEIVKKNLNKKILFIGRQSDFDQGAKILKQINFLDGSPTFIIVEI